MANARRKGGGMGYDTVAGHQRAGTAAPGTLDEHDLAADMQGRNALQAQDQSRVHNQRLAQPGWKDPEEVELPHAEGGETAPSEGIGEGETEEVVFPDLERAEPDEETEAVKEAASGLES